MNITKILSLFLVFILFVGIINIIATDKDQETTVECDQELLQVCKNLLYTLDSNCNNGEFDTECKLNQYQILKQGFSENCSKCVSKMEYNEKLMKTFGEQGGFTYIDGESLLLVDMNFSDLDNDDLRSVFRQIVLLNIFIGPIQRLEIDTYNNKISSFESAFYYVQSLVHLTTFDINLGLNQLNDSNGIEYLKDLQLTDLLLWMEHNQLHDIEPFYNILEIDSLEFILMTLDSNEWSDQEEADQWKEAMDDKFPFSEKTVWV